MSDKLRCAPNAQLKQPYESLLRLSFSNLIIIKLDLLIFQNEELFFFLKFPIYQEVNQFYNAWDIGYTDIFKVKIV